MILGTSFDNMCRFLFFCTTA